MVGNTLNDRPVTYRDVLRNGNWIRLWIGQTISQLGDAMALTAFPLLVYQVSGGSVVSLGAGFAIQLLPLVIISPLAGTFVDRCNRRTLLISVDVIRTLCALGIFFSTSLWQLYGLALTAAIMQAFFLPTYSALIPQLTGDQYVKSISLSYTGYRLMQVIGPAITGGLVAILAGPRPVFLLDAVTFAVAGLMTTTIVVAPLAHKPQMGKFLDDLGMALDFLKHNAVVRYIAGYNVCLNMGIAIATLGLVAYIKTVTEYQTDQLYAWSVAVLAFTIACVTWFIGYFDYRLPKRAIRAMILGGPVLAGLSYGLFYFQPGYGSLGPYNLLFLIFIVGIGQAFALVPTVAYLATATPDGLRGRVYAFINASVALAQLAVFTLSGTVGLLLPPWALLVISSAFFTVGIPLCTFTLNGLQAMRDHDGVA